MDVVSCPAPSSYAKRRKGLVKRVLGGAGHETRIVERSEKAIKQPPIHRISRIVTKTVFNIPDYKHRHCVHCRDSGACNVGLIGYDIHAASLQTCILASKLGRRS